ncbi:hypothetical protein HYH03_007173 [Edaphochlamys debaryana]|uniref:Uncharacterized protein n=1 Tax=Edaphochlamys debaryana TaxID=47281 RepID=A0A835Y128_9CHLO|nr:hypothetical protein HYH03_007173 [Edaphochlamys debaryana]|eukprot:KAG2494657.1 hypothetical protein HYH03_007173 [Edaphochlamys debaryana]
MHRAAGVDLRSLPCSSHVQGSRCSGRPSFSRPLISHVTTSLDEARANSGRHAGPSTACCCADAARLVDTCTPESAEHTTGRRGFPFGAPFQPGTRTQRRGTTQQRLAPAQQQAQQQPGPSHTSVRLQPRSGSPSHTGRLNGASVDTVGSCSPLPEPMPPPVPGLGPGPSLGPASSSYSRNGNSGGGAASFSGSSHAPNGFAAGPGPGSSSAGVGAGSQRHWFAAAGPHPAELTRSIGACNSWRELSVLLAQHAPHMNAVHVTAAATRLARLPPPRPDSSPECACEGSTCTCLREEAGVAGASVSSSNGAGSALGADAAQQEWAACVQTVVGLVDAKAAGLDARGVANVAWALAKAMGDGNADAGASTSSKSGSGSGSAGGVSGLRDATRRTVARLLSLPAADPAAAARGGGGGLSPQHLANSLWAVASLELPTLDAQPGPASKSGSNGAGGGGGYSMGWAQRALAAAQPLLRAGAFSEEGLSQLVWAVAELRLAPSAAWWEDYYAAVRRTTRALSSHSTANILLSLARLASAAADAAAAAADGDADDAPSTSAPAPSRFLRGATNGSRSTAPDRKHAMSFRPPSEEWLRFLLGDCAARFLSADGAAVANSLWALQVLCSKRAVTSPSSPSSSSSSPSAASSPSAPVPRSWLRSVYGCMTSPGAMAGWTDVQLSRSVWSLAALAEAAPGGLPMQPPPAVLAAAAEALAQALPASSPHSIALASWGLARLTDLQQPYHLQPPPPPGQAAAGLPAAAAPPQPWAPQPAWAQSWMRATSACLGQVDSYGLLCCLQAATVLGKVQPVGRGLADEDAALEAEAWAEAAAEAALDSRHAAADRPRLVAALVRAAAAAVPGGCPPSVAGAAAETVLAGAADGAWSAAELLRCALALAEAGVAPPMAWRSGFFGRVMRLAGVAPMPPAAPMPSHAVAAAAGGEGLGPGRPGLGPAGLGGAEVALLLRCSRIWGASPSDATLRALLGPAWALAGPELAPSAGAWGLGWDPQVAVEVCRELALTRQTVPPAQPQPQAPPAQPQPQAQAQAPSPAQPLDPLESVDAAAAASAAPEPEPEPLAGALGRGGFNGARPHGAPIAAPAVASPSGVPSRPHLNGSSLPGGPASAAGRAGAQGQAGYEEDLETELRLRACMEDLEPPEPVAAGRRDAVLGLGPQRPWSTAAAAGTPAPPLLRRPPPALGTWPGDSSGSDADVAAAAFSAAAAAVGASSSGEWRGGVLAVAPPPLLQGPPRGRAAGAASTPAGEFVLRMLGLACAAQQAPQHAHHGPGPHASLHSSNGASAAPPPASSPAPPPWPAHTFAQLLWSAGRLRLRPPPYLREPLSAALNAAIADPHAAPADLIPLAWGAARMGLRPHPAAAGALAETLGGRPELAPGVLPGWQLLMTLQALAEWRVVPPLAWSVRVPAPLLRWLGHKEGGGSGGGGDMALVLMALRLLNYLRSTAPTAAAAAVAAASRQAGGGGGGKARAAAQAAALAEAEAALDNRVWPQLWPAMRSLVRRRLVQLFGPAAARSGATASPRERLAALALAERLSVMAQAECATQGVAALRSLAHTLPPNLYPVYLYTCARLRDRARRAALEELLMTWCNASAPRLDDMPPPLLHATLRAAGRAAAALRLPVPPDWAGAALRRYSRRCAALPPRQLAQVPGVLVGLRRAPPDAWAAGYVEMVRRRLPYIAPAAAAEMIRDAAKFSPELAAALNAAVTEHVAAVASVMATEGQGEGPAAAVAGEGRVAAQWRRLAAEALERRRQRRETEAAARGVAPRPPPAGPRSGAQAHTPAAVPSVSVSAASLVGGQVSLGPSPPAAQAEHATALASMQTVTSVLRR